MISEYPKNILVIKMIDKIPLELRPVESPLCHLSQKDRCSYWMRIKPQCQGPVRLTALNLNLTFSDILKPTDGLVVLLFISDFAILQVAEEIYLKAKIKVMIEIRKIVSSFHSTFSSHSERLSERY